MLLLIEQGNQYDEAIIIYKRLLSVNKNSSYAMLQIGHCYEKIGNSSNALAYYYKSIHYDPSMDKAWYRLSKYFLKNKN